MTSPARTLPEHEKHTHLLRGLDCGQYEALIAACGQQCQACGGTSQTRGGGKLFMDHDHRIGDWAIRGMLCRPCNTNLPFDRPDPDWATSYLSNPWWKRLLAEFGVEVEMPEPAECRVTDFFGRAWWRERDGNWSAGIKAHGTYPTTEWRLLLRKYGPHNLTPIPNSMNLPRVSVSRLMRDGFIRRRIDG